MLSPLLWDRTLYCTYLPNHSSPPNSTADPNNGAFTKHRPARLHDRSYFNGHIVFHRHGLVALG